jgi:pyrimidine and pyridine-specific 5'-nucleotidase
MKQAGLSDPSKCYFVDDNRGHVDAARALGWAKCVHFCERENLEGEKIHTERENGVVEIATLEQLRSVWPEIFVKHP